MEVADLVKFAKYSASILESDTALGNMTDFVNESYAHYQKMKAEEEAQQAQMKNVKQDEMAGKEDVKDV
jgi:cell division protein FtsB